MTKKTIGRSMICLFLFVLLAYVLDDSLPPKKGSPVSATVVSFVGEREFTEKGPGRAWTRAVTVRYDGWEQQFYKRTHYLLSKVTLEDLVAGKELKCFHQRSAVFGRHFIGDCTT